MRLIRPATTADCSALGLITVTASHSAFIGVVPEECLDFSWTPDVSASNWRSGFSGYTDRGQLFDVLELDERVIGFIWAKPWAATPGVDASVQALYVLPTFHRQGHGRNLLRHAVSILTDAGARSLEIACVKENPNCGFYEHLGGVEIGRRPVKVDSFDTEEILFGWEDSGVLI